MANVPRCCDCPCHQTLGDALRCDGERCYCGNVRKALGGQQVKDAPVMGTLLHENRQLRARLDEHRGALELAAKSAKLADENKLLREEAATFEAVTDDWEREVQRYRRHLDEATRFIAGLNLQDHPRATVQAQRAMVIKLNDVLRPQCSKNDAKAQESARALASGATYSNAAPHMPAPATLKDETMADTIRRVFAPGQRSPIDFKINLDGKDIANAHFKRGNRGSP